CLYKVSIPVIRIVIVRPSVIVPASRKGDRMVLSVQQHAVFVQRTHDAYQLHKRRARAAGQFVDFGLDDLRAYVLNNLGDRRCQYCRGPIPAGGFALSPKVPPERGGSFAFHTLVVTCAACDRAKGVLDYVEFKELMHLLRTWAPAVRARFLARLRTGVANGRELPPLPHPARFLGGMKEEG